MTDKPLTGYPSIDKPWLKYYRNEPVRQIKLDQTIYDLVFETNRSNPAAPAISYMGTTWSFSELKSKTDIAAKSFAGAGLKPGDVVLLGLPNIPEAVVCLLALNKIGVISKWFDVRAGENDIADYLMESNCHHTVILDILVPVMEKVAEKINISKVLVVSPVDSLSKVIQIGYRMKNPQKDINGVCGFQKFTDFIRDGKKFEEPKKAIFDKNRPSIMIQSSGTTGKPKVIVHSDYSATAAVHHLAYSDLPIGEGKVILNVLPPWIAYAIGEALLYPLALGAKVILHPTMEDETLVKYLGNFTCAMAVPLHYRYLFENFSKIEKKKTDKFLKKAECMISGGDKLSSEENKAFEELFGVPVVNGWGNNEGWGCLAVNPAQHNCYGSVGIPKYGETIIAFDNETRKEQKFNDVGEICVNTDTLFLGYEGNNDETNAVKKLHQDGRIWLHTGDLGYIDENGFVFLAGRIRRVITRAGFKISAYTIEEAITRNPAVKECVAVEVEDSEEGHVPMAYLVLKDTAQEEGEVKNQLLENLSRDLKSYEIPKYFRFMTELPYTQNNKYDFRLLESMGNEWVRRMR